MVAGNNFAQGSFLKRVNRWRLVREAVYPTDFPSSTLHWYVVINMYIT